MNSVAQRLATKFALGSILLVGGCKSANHRPGIVFTPAPVASSDANVQPSKATPGLGKSWIIPTEFSDTIVSPLSYADYIAQNQGSDARMIETAHIIQSMARLSEDLDRTLADRNNTDPVATRQLQAAVKDFKQATHYVEHPNYGKSAECDAPLVASPQTNPAIALACSIRSVVSTATGDIVMEDANLFQKDGLKAAQKINHDFDAFRSFQRRAEKIEGVSFSIADRL